MKGDKKKGDSEESPNEKERVDEFVNEWCRLYRETSQACSVRNWHIKHKRLSDGI